MTRTCGLCSKPVDGFAQINDTWYCHPDDLDKPDCYSLAQRIISIMGRPHQFTPEQLDRLRAFLGES